MTSALPDPEVVRCLDLGPIAQWLTAHGSDMVADLEEYVGHETPSTDKPLLDQGADWITKWMTDRLGPLEIRRLDRAAHGDVMLVDVPGSHDPHSPSLLLLCHYDTVWDAGTIDNRPFQVIDGAATGPGAFDMKAGLVQAVWALQALQQLGRPRPPVRFLLNGDEELGSVESRGVIEQQADVARAVLVLEPSQDAAVKTSRKGVGQFELEVAGLEAHAGLDPTLGVSAVHELARLVLRLGELADPAVGTTVNVGMISGGTRPNVVAGRANATVDVRVSSGTEAQRVSAAFAALQPTDPRVSVRSSGGWNRPPMERTEGIAAMYALARELATALGFELKETAAGGGSDGNFVADRGVPLLDGLGPVGAGAHSRSEWVDVAAMPGRAALVAGMLLAFAAGESG